MHGHFQSHDKGGDHATRSKIAKNQTLHANFMAVCFTEPNLLPIKVLYCGNKIFLKLFLLLWPWTWSVLPGDVAEVQNELPTSRLSKVIVWHKNGQTDGHTVWNHTPHHFTLVCRLNSLSQLDRIWTKFKLTSTILDKICNSGSI